MTLLYTLVALAAEMAAALMKNPLATAVYADSDIFRESQTCYQ